MKTFNINYQARLKNTKEQDFCNAIIDALQKSSTQANTVTFARKTKSYGSTGVAHYRATKSRDGKVKEIWVNLGKLSNTNSRTSYSEFAPKFSAIPKIAEYAESDRITIWFNK
tara:strand:+ start:1879 stop:2217 length:339 start_codon:yes stop_codon:yes gene_type:complete